MKNSPLSPADFAQCCNCHRPKMFHNPHYFPVLRRKTKTGVIVVLDFPVPMVEDGFGRKHLLECREFDNRFIRIMGDSRRFHSVKEAKEAGAL